MELNSTYNTVCSLLGAALFGRVPEIANETDWNAVYSEMKAQTVQGLAAGIFPELPIPEEIKKTWQKESLYLFAKGNRLCFAQAELTDLLEKAGVPYVILKGTSAAMYYPEPLLRVMGDVDIFVPAQFFDAAAELMNENGYMQQRNEEDNKRHVAYKKQGILFELHHSFAMVNSTEEKQYLDRLLENCCLQGKTETVEQNGQRFQAPPVLVNGMVLLEHIAQHMISGLGLRQIVDWMMFADKVLDDSAWQLFREMAANAGLETLARTVTRMCCIYFGLEGNFSWCNDADRHLCDELMSYLFDNGNFGRKQGHAGRIATVRTHYKTTENLFSTLQRTGEHNWKLYQKYRFLKPFAGIYQLFRYSWQMLTVPKKLGSIISGKNEAQRRQNMMAGLGITCDY